MYPNIECVSNNVRICLTESLYAVGSKLSVAFLHEKYSGQVRVTGLQANVSQAQYTCVNLVGSCSICNHKHNLGIDG